MAIVGRKCLVLNVTPELKLNQIVVAILIVFALPFTALAADRGLDDETCFSCHDTIRQEQFAASIHALNGCTSCHSDVAEIPHSIKPSAVDCSVCHEEQAKAYQKGVHGQALAAGKRDAPVCADCHGEHFIKSRLDPASKTYPTAISTQICAQCHASERIATKYHLPLDRVKTYLDSYHGLASKFGVVTVANCASCHGAHEILPSNDPRSSVHKKNLAQTCGKCHPGVGTQIAKGNIHVAPTAAENRIVFYVSRFYVILITFVIGGMLIHNILDFLSKLRKHYAKKKQSDVYPRFTIGERIQHLVLTVVFIILAYTGFALKYPEAWWAFPFTSFEGAGDWRGRIHRASAIIFVALSIHHLIFMSFTKRGRRIGKELALRKKDFRDLKATLRYDLGKAEKPHYESYSYVEKFEYGALMWGSMIMILTGTMLTFENLAMKYLPKWSLDVATAIHFYEAVLATLAILVWHFYFVIFDPDHYPMNWSMVSGKVSEKEKAMDDQSKG